MSEVKNRSIPQVAGALIGTVALVGSGAVAASYPAYAQVNDDEQAASVQQTEMRADNAFVKVAQAEGEFSYSQDVVTPNERIASVFKVAAVSLCSSMPQYIATELEQNVTVGGSAASGQYVGTVADMADEEGATAFTMACSCASNLAGGGAIANADVSGVSLESVAALVGAL